MKKIFSLLMVVLSTAAFAQVMTVSVDDDSWEVCPTDVVNVNVSRSTPSNNAVAMNGSSSYLEIPYSTYTSFGTSSFSVEFWVNLNSVSQSTYLAYNRSATNQGWDIYVDQQGFVGFRAEDAIGTNINMIGNITPINDAIWHHVAVTLGRGTTPEVNIYVDGIPEIPITNFTLGDISSNASTFLGYGISPNSGNATYANGEFDEYRAWSEERSSGDIQTYMSTHLNPASFPTLAQNFDFNELVSATGWVDCVEGEVAPAGTSAPSISLAGGPAMTFNFAYTWNTLVTGLSQNGPNFQETFDADDTVLVSTGYCKYEAFDTVYVTALDCDTLTDPRDVAAVFAPTAFTPNGDEKNDYYIVKANAISYFEMQVYNRLGNILFYSKDINTGWDGTFDNSTCYEGVYVAKIIYRDLEGIEYVKYQQFSLMR
jgi:gliding motility-associated-like protein